MIYNKTNRLIPITPLILSGIILAYLLTNNGTYISNESYEADLKADCLAAADKIIEEKGDLNTFIQWTRYSKWTHAEQCSEFLEKY